MNIEGADKIYKTMRVLIKDKPGYLGRLCTVIGDHGANIGEISRVKVGVQYNTRDVSLTVASEEHLRAVMESVIDLAREKLVPPSSPGNASQTPEDRGKH